jgi:periplasmic protein TonB
MYQLITANLDDIVFESRNKEYGAYALRKKYAQNVFVAFFLAMFIVVVALALPLLMTFLNGITPEPETLNLSTRVEMMEVPALVNEKAPVLPPEEAGPPPKRSAIKFVIPEPVSDDVAEPEESLVEMNKMVGENIDKEEVIGEVGDPERGIVKGKGKIFGPEEAPKEDTPDPATFVDVEQEPSPVNMADFRKNIGYPVMAKEANISGRVTLKVLVDTDGNVEKYIILKSPHQLLTDACTQQIKQLKFTPAIQAGKPIKFWLTVPVDFKLQ